MKNLYSILFLFLLLSRDYSAQIYFQKTYGGVRPECNECFNRSTGVINITNDQGFIVSHSTLSYGSGPFSQGIYFLKLNKHGDTVFTRTFYDLNHHAYGRSVYQAADGGYILGIGVNPYGTGLVKTDAIGNILWSKKVNAYHMGYYGLRLKDNNFLATGGSILAKLDNSGNLIFGKQYSAGTSTQITLYSSESCANGDIISVGFIGYYSNYDIFVVKTDIAGNVKFARKYGNNNMFEAGYKAVELSDKSIAVIGYTEPYGGGDYNMSLLRVDSVGNPLVFKSIGDSYYQWANSIVKDASDNLYFTGVTTYSSSPVWNQASAVMIKTNSSGTLLDMRRYDNVEYGNGLIFTAAGELAICGMTAKSGAGGQDLFVVKTNSAGTAGCNINAQTLPVNNVTYVSDVVSLTVSNTLTISDYSLVTRAGTQVGTICYSCTVPDLNVTATKTLICAGDKSKLTATGADTYSWSTGASSNTVLVGPATTATYMLTGYTGPQCMSTVIYTVNVSKCLSVDQEEKTTAMNIYPVPSGGHVNIRCADPIERLEVLDGKGAIVYVSAPMEKRAEFDLDIPGIYYVRVLSNNSVLNSRFIIE